VKNEKIEPIHIAQYIILRFVAVMIFIYISNIVIEWLMQVFVLPFLMDTIFQGRIQVEGSARSSIISLIIGILFGTLLSQLPGPIQSVLKGTLFSGLDLSIVMPSSTWSNAFFGLSISKVFLLSIMFFLFIITISPYIIGGVWFLNCVWNKVTELVLHDRKKAKEYEEKRNLLLSDIAHDIKTPITAMSGYAKALSDGLVPEEKQREYLQSIYTKSMRVSDLINMMFEYIKLDSAGYSLSLAKEDVTELTRIVAAECYQDFEEAGIEFEIEISDTPCIMEVDKLQLSRVITNLLNNAVKYLNPGNTVKLQLIDNYDKHLYRNTVQIRVADDGEQISDELADDIFTPFSRGDQARSTKGGNGLGLSIAYKIIELHKGTLVLDRNPRDGFTKAFVINL